MATIRAIAAWFNPRRRTIAIVLVGWIALVIVGAGQSADGDDWIALPDLSGLLVAVVGVMALLGLLFLIYIRPSARSAAGPRQKQSLRTLIYAAVIFVALAVSFGPQEALEEEPLPEEDTAQSAEREDFGSVTDTEDGSSDINIVAVVVIGTLAAAMLLRSWLLAAPTSAAVDELPDESPDVFLRSAIDDATRRLQLGTDPRSGVLAAYDGLERALAARGQPREPTETPTEHMARVLVDVPTIAEPAVELGRLYELARFSDHPISEDDRQQAVEQLAAARRSLVPVSGGSE